MSKPRLFGALFLAFGANAAQAGLVDSCPGGLIGVRAQVVSVTPPSALLTKRVAGSKASEPLTLNGVLCAGDTLEFHEGTVVELSLGGRSVVVRASYTLHTLEGGLRQLSGIMLGYLEALGQSIASPKPPPRRVSPTVAKGDYSSPNEALRAIQPLRDLPRQLLAADTRPVVSWHGGIEPWRCNWLDANGNMLALGDASDSAECTAPPPPAAAVALEAVDHRGTSLIWRIERVALETVPRPEWVAPGAPALDVVTRAAWAVWLWREGGPAWRLQAIAMLNDAREVWLAGWLLGGILAEVPPVHPK